MLRGGTVGLRARETADVAVLHAELYEDVAEHCRSDSRPWVPIAAGSEKSPYTPAEASDRATCFSVVRLSDDALAGEALLWQLDQHNRMAHIGIALRPGFRGQGLGRDAVTALCHYGFVVRGLNRLQIDTLADNGAMIGVAERLGFRREALLRRSAWVSGEFVDEVLLGLLADEWRAPATG
jgi:RimJ/RimL family protein N-acetyltransferase